jgi:anti-sigma B factor antagonist
MDLSLLQRHVKDVLVVDMAGRVTTYDDTLRECVRRSLEQGERRFVLNLKDVSYIDSAGLGQLVRAYTTVLNAGGELRLLSPGPRVRYLLEITKLNTVFTVLDSESAIAA